jgi:serine protease Do
VTSPADIEKRVEAARKADRKFVLMLIQREGGVQYIPMPLTKSGGKDKDKQPG